MKMFTKLFVAVVLTEIFCLPTTANADGFTITNIHPAIAVGPFMDWPQATPTPTSSTSATSSSQLTSVDRGWIGFQVTPIQMEPRVCTRQWVGGAFVKVEGAPAGWAGVGPVDYKNVGMSGPSTYGPFAAVIDGVPTDAGFNFVEAGSKPENWSINTSGWPSGNFTVRFFYDDGCVGVTALAPMKFTLRELPQPTLLCQLPTSAIIGRKILGSCSSSFVLNSTPVKLQSNAGSGWKDLGSGFADGNKIPISIVPNKLGNLQIRVQSEGVLDKLKPFVSNISTILIQNSQQSKVSIFCVKGKLTKTVTAVKPICPAGYKKK